MNKSAPPVLAMLMIGAILILLWLGKNYFPEFAAAPRQNIADPFE